MFIINWLFDKLGYIPKSKEDDFKKLLITPVWPFPVEEKKPVTKKKPALKKATTRKPKPAVVAKTARTKKAK